MYEYGCGAIREEDVVFCADCGASLCFYTYTETESKHLKALTLRRLTGRTGVSLQHGTYMDSCCFCRPIGTN